MSNRKVGIEFTVAGAAAVQRDVNKIANSIGSAAKFGLKFAGVQFSALYVGRALKSFYSDAISNSKEATKQIDAMNNSWAETKRLVGQGMGNAMAPLYRDINGVIQAINVAIRDATELQNLFNRLTPSQQASVTAQYEQATGGKFGYYDVKTATAGAFSLAGSYSASNRTTRQYTGPDDQILAYNLMRQELSADALNGVSQSQEAARAKVVQLNEALNNQIRAQQMLSEGQKHGAEILTMRAALEEAYAGDMDTRTKKLEYYTKGLEKLDAIQQKIKDAEAATKAKQEVSQLNDELDREFLIIGRLNDSHERAAKAVAYESAVRKAYADNIETQNRLIAEYESKLRSLERHAELVATGEQFGDAWGNALEEFAVDGEKASEVARSLAKDLQRLALRQLVTQPFANFMSNSFIGLFSGGGVQTSAAGPGTSAFGSATVATAQAHGGGVLGYDALRMRQVHPAVFAGAARAHGGIGPGERPLIVRNDEGIFTPGQMRALGRGGSAATEALLGELLDEIRRQGERRMMILDRRQGVTRDEVAGIIIDDLDHAGPVATALGR